MTVEVELAGQAFTLLNGGPRFTRNPTVSFFVELPDVAGVDRVAGALLEGGSALMPLDTYPWSARYAWVVDRFGVSWQVMHSPAKTPRIVPCLMFSDVVHGRAEGAAPLRRGSRRRDPHARALRPGGRTRRAPWSTVGRRSAVASWLRWTATSPTTWHSTRGSRCRCWPLIRPRSTCGGTHCPRAADLACAGGSPTDTACHGRSYPSRSTSG